jgi:hypothetical protein
MNTLPFRASAPEEAGLGKITAIKSPALSLQKRNYLASLRNTPTSSRIWEMEASVFSLSFDPMSDSKS